MKQYAKDYIENYAYEIADEINKEIQRGKKVISASMTQNKSYSYSALVIYEED